MHSLPRSAILIVMAPAFWAVPAYAGCAGWDPVAPVVAQPPRPITARDLIDLVNIGRPDAEPVEGPTPLGLSPDGRYVAAVLQRADLATNGYCQALVVVDVTGRAPPRVLDRGGDYLMVKGASRGMYMSIGFPRLDPARWSPDGRSIAFLKRLDGRTQLWRATLDGKPAGMVTHADDDINQWAWSSDGRSLLYSVDRGRVAADTAIDQEGRSGWHFDERMAPHIALRPQIPGPLPQDEVAIDPDSDATRPASAAERALLALDGAEPITGRRKSRAGLTAWAELAGTAAFAPWTIRAVDPHGKAIACAAPACSGRLKDLWWSRDGKLLSFLKLEGWDGRYTALYRWRPGRGQPVRVLRTDDVIQGCVPNGSALLCVRQGSLQPPRLVAIDVSDGRQRVLLDPNPSIRNLRLGKVQRLEWSTEKGLPVYGDLVLPPDYAGGRLPVIVTQYWSRGFLRGGTGNDYPIQLFAQAGFAVLSISRPPSAATADPAVKAPDDIDRAELRDWAERRSMNSAINRGLDLLIARGIADPTRLGLTGVSDGASGVRFALINTPRFAAAALSSCCVDESSDDVVGPAWEKESTSYGYPPAYPVDRAFWRPYSLALNADRVATPLLMQLADYELLVGVHAYAALRSQGQPTDLYFYPDEYHNKWQPEHRAAVFERDLDWFSFWLQGHDDPSPAKAAMFARWRAWREQRRGVPGGKVP